MRRSDVENRVPELHSIKERTEEGALPSPPSHDHLGGKVPTLGSIGEDTEHFQVLENAGSLQICSLQLASTCAVPCVPALDIHMLSFLLRSPAKGDQFILLGIILYSDLGGPG